MESMSTATALAPSQSTGQVAGQSAAVAKSNTKSSFAGIFQNAKAQGDNKGAVAADSAAVVSDSVSAGSETTDSLGASEAVQAMDATVLAGIMMALPLTTVLTQPSGQFVGTDGSNANTDGGVNVNSLAATATFGQTLQSSLAVDTAMNSLQQSMPSSLKQPTGAAAAMITTTAEPQVLNGQTQTIVQQVSLVDTASADESKTTSSLPLSAQPNTSSLQPNAPVIPQAVANANNSAANMQQQEKVVTGEPVLPTQTRIKPEVAVQQQVSTVMVTQATQTNAAAAELATDEDAQILPANEVKVGANLPLNQIVQPAGEKNAEGKSDSGLLNQSGEHKVQQTASEQGMVTSNQAELFGQMVDNRMIAGSQPSADTLPTNSSVKDTYQVAQQIVEQAKLIRSPFTPENSQMIITLKPEHLGELMLKVSVDAGVVTAAFHTNNSEVRSIIENSLPQLKQDMANQGLKVDNVGVYAGLSQFQSDNHQQNTQQFTTAKTLKRKFSEEELAAIEELQPSTTAMTDDGVNYLV